MKYRVLILMLMVLGTIGAEVNAQGLYKTIQPMKENGFENFEFTNFALGQSQLSQSFSSELLNNVNRFLTETGLNVKVNQGMPLDRRHLAWIFDPSRTWSVERTYSNGYWNSHQSRDGSYVEWYWDKKYFRGQAKVLHYEGYELDLGKGVCMNLLKIPYISVCVTPPIQQETYCPPALTAPTESFVPYRKPAVEVTLPAVVLAPKKHNHTLLWVAAGIVVTGVACYFLSQKHSNHPQIDTGGPGGAPITPGVPDPNPVIPGGGPGGAPTTK